MEMETSALILLIILILVVVTATGIIIYLMTKKKTGSSCSNLITPIPTTITQGGQILGSATYTGDPIVTFGAVLSTTDPTMGTTINLYDGGIDGPILGTLSTTSPIPQYLTTSALQTPQSSAIVIGTGPGTGPGTVQLVTIDYL